MATRLFTFQHTNFEAANPVVPTSANLTLQAYINYLNSIRSGSVSADTSFFALYDQVRATATLVDNGLVGADVAGVTISGVDATVTYATSINNTLSLIKNKINAGGNTPNALVTRAVSATRYFTDATGTFTMSDCPAGTVTPSVDGTAVPFTAVGDDTIDAAALALAINAQATAGVKVRATSALGVVTVTAQATNRATLTISSGAGTVGCRINGFLVTVPWTTTDTNSATLLTAAINADTRINTTVRAVNSSAGVVTVLALSAGDKMPAVGATGSGITVGGVATPLTTLTIATGSGTLSAYIDGNLVASVTATGTDATDAVALAKAINANFYARRTVIATSALGVVTLSSRAGITLGAVGTGVTASAAYLTASGTYGGIAGNALTLTSADAAYCIRSGATLTGGVTGVLVTATAPGVSGNAITFAAGGAASGHVTASGTRLGASAGGFVVAGAETTRSFSFS